MSILGHYVCLSLIIAHVVCQRYAERNPLPKDTLPFEDHYDDDYTEGYDFHEEKNIFRWNVEEFPHPRENFRYCNRLKASYVCDPDQVLEREQADKLDDFIRQLYRETLCICKKCDPQEGGIVVGIALLKNMFQPYNQHPSKTIRSFAETLRNKWKLGKCDNDILIVVATTDRLSFTDVGKATSSYVSLEEAHRIFLENKSYFSAGNFYEGLRAMLATYYDRTRDMKLPVEDTTNMGVLVGSIVGTVVLLGIILFLVVFLCRRFRSGKDLEANHEQKSDSTKREGVTSSWTKRDIKVLFGSMKAEDKPSTKYIPCGTEEDLDVPDFKIEGEVIDTTLAHPDQLNDTQVTTTTTVDSSQTEMLDRDLTEAVENIAKTFQPKREYKGHQTDL